MHDDGQYREPLAQFIDFGRASRTLFPFTVPRDHSPDLSHITTIFWAGELAGHVLVSLLHLCLRMHGHDDVQLPGATSER
jgi:hypothetical protein